MQNEQQLIIKALTPGELADLYEITTKTLKSMVDMHKEKIGKRGSKYFTSLQVKKIYDCLGVPKGVYKSDEW